MTLATRHTAVLEASERHEARNRRLARLVADAVRAGEDLTIDATPLLSEEGRLLAVESGRRDPEDVSSGSPFHADPVSDDGARLEPLGDDEAGRVVDVTPPLDEVVAAALDALAAHRDDVRRS